MPLVTAAAPAPTSVVYKPPQSPRAAIAQAVSAVTPQDSGQLPNNEAVVEAVASVEGVNPLQEPATPEAKPEDVSKNLAVLAKRERAMRLEAQKIRAERDALKAREPELQSALAFKDKLTKDPLGTLSELGITYDQLVNQVLTQAQPENPELVKLKAELKADFKAQQDALNKQLEDQQAQTYEQAVNQMRTDVKSYVAANPTYEAIAATDSSETVVEYIKQTFEETGQLLSIEEAAKDVEDHLLEELTGYYQKLTKIQSKLTPPTPVAPPTQQEPKAQPKTPIKTLTNAVTPPPSQSLSRKERRERAILAFQGKLNQ